MLGCASLFFVSIQTGLAITHKLNQLAFPVVELWYAVAFTHQFKSATNWLTLGDT